MRDKDKQIGGDHYSKRKIQPFDIIDEYNLDFYEANVLKYLLRHKDKNGREDILKLIDYAECVIDRQYPYETPKSASSGLGKDDNNTYQYFQVNHDFSSPLTEAQYRDMIADGGKLIDTYIMADKLSTQTNYSISEIVSFCRAYSGLIFAEKDAEHYILERHRCGYRL